MTVIEFIQKVIGALENGLFVEFLLGVLGIMLLRIAYRLQKTANNIDFTALIVGADGQVSLIKLMQFVGFIVATWIIIVYTVRGTLTEWLFTAYFGVASGTQIINRFANRVEVMPTSVTATAPPGQAATVTVTAPAAPQNPPPQDT
jgi:hypothetical protein